MMETKKRTFAFQWHITDECDQRCKHCYIYSAGLCSFTAIPYEQMTHVLDSVEDFCERNNRDPYLYITGGDPILHPDFWQLLAEAQRREMRVAIMGNPFHLDEQVCARLKSLGVRKYQLSVDGLEATHDEFRMPGSYASTLRAIPLIRNAGMWCAILSTVSSRNIAELPDVIDLMGDMDVDVYTFGRYCPTSGQRRDELQPEPRFRSARYANIKCMMARASNPVIIDGPCRPAVANKRVLAPSQQPVPNADAARRPGVIPCDTSREVS